MITVTLNRTEFEYDIHSLIKAFFPKEDVELYYTKEAHADEKNVAGTNHSAEQEEAGSSHFSIDYADDRISIAWDDAPDGPARRTFAGADSMGEDSEVASGSAVIIGRSPTAVRARHGPHPPQTR